MYQNRIAPVQPDTYFELTHCLTMTVQRSERVNNNSHALLGDL